MSKNVPPPKKPTFCWHRNWSGDEARARLAAARGALGIFYLQHRYSNDFTTLAFPKPPEEKQKTRN